MAARALGLELSLAAAAAVTAFTILFQVVHFTPGGIGVYEASMTAALQAQGMPGGAVLTLAVLTHGLKFAYSFALGAPLTLLAFSRLPSLGRIRASREDSKRAGRFEIVAARLWNVLNEGKPFTPVFVVGTLVLLGVPQSTDGGYWLRQLIALVVLLPLFAVFYCYAFPLRLRAELWVLLAACLALFRVFDPAAIALVLGLYLGFTVVLWGSIYYHLRIGTPWTNGLRFWRLVIENPDPTSGNFIEQVPKLLILVLLSGHLVDHPGALSIAAVEAFTVVAAALAVLSHQWWFTWAPPDPLAPTRLRNSDRGPLCRRVILIVIDGCRADRFAEARTPFLDRLAAEGVVCEDMRTVYPARTVTAFTSMLTGAPPRVHGMRSNFVPSLGAKCESIFGVLEQRGLRGRLAGIAHLVDSFGEETVETVTAVTPNEEIDEALVARAREVLQRDDPELLVLQTLSVDQTGHARGSYYPEYIERIEATDRLLEEFLGWCPAAVYLDADLEYDPAEIPALLAPIEAGEADYVLGSRFLGRREGHARWRSAGNRVFTLALSFAAGRRISDGQMGFRAFSARALNVAEIVHDYNYAQVLTLDLLHKGMRLAEVPVSYRSRARGRSFINGHYLWRVPLGMARELLGSQP